MNLLRVSSLGRNPKTFSLAMLFFVTTTSWSSKPTIPTDLASNETVQSHWHYDRSSRELLLSDPTCPHAFWGVQKGNIQKSGKKRSWVPFSASCNQRTIHLIWNIIGGRKKCFIIDVLPVSKTNRKVLLSFFKNYEIDFFDQISALLVVLNFYLLFISIIQKLDFKISSLLVLSFMTRQVDFSRHILSMANEWWTELCANL